MKLEELLLTKEEIPVVYHPGGHPIFYVPIHPALLRPDVQIDPEIPKMVFSQVAKEWYDELKAFTKDLKDDNPDKEWFQRVFLKKRPKIKKEFERQRIFPIYWEDYVDFDDNGFARVLSISRDAGGSLFFNKSEMPGIIMAPYVNFSPEKFSSYRLGEPFPDEPNAALAHVYGHHNVDYYPGALFLRNWALLTLNESMKFLGDKLFEEDKIDRREY